MKINLDTTNKTITLLEPVSIAELFELEKIIPTIKDWEIKGKIQEVKKGLDLIIKDEHRDIINKEKEKRDRRQKIINEGIAEYIEKMKKYSGDIYNDKLLTPPFIITCETAQTEM